MIDNLKSYDDDSSSDYETESDVESEDYDSVDSDE